MLLLLLNITFLYRSSPLHSPTESQTMLIYPERNLASETTSTRSNIDAMTQMMATHVLCCPGIAISRVVMIDSSDDNRPPDGAIWTRRVVSHASILKARNRFPRWTFPRLTATRKQHRTIIRFCPLVGVRFITATGIESSVHDSPITSDAKDTRRSPVRRCKSIPIVKLPKI